MSYSKEKLITTHPTSPKGHLWGGNWYWRKRRSGWILALSVIWIAFMRKFHILLRQIKMNINIRQKPTIYLKVALGSQKSFPVLPRLKSLNSSVLGFWAPGIRGENWAEPVGEAEAGVRYGACPWLSGWLSNYVRVTCSSSCWGLTSQLLLDFSWGKKHS